MSEAIKFKVPATNFANLVSTLHSTLAQLALIDVTSDTTMGDVKRLVEMLEAFQDKYTDPNPKHVSFSAMTRLHLRGMGFVEGRLSINWATLRSRVSDSDTAIAPSQTCVDYLHRVNYLTDVLCRGSSEASALGPVGSILCEVAWQICGGSTKEQDEYPQILFVSQPQLPMSFHSKGSGTVTHSTIGRPDVNSYKLPVKTGQPLTKDIVRDGNEVKAREVEVIVVEVKSEANFDDALHRLEVAAQAANVSQTLLKKPDAVRYIMTDSRRWKFGILHPADGVFYTQEDHFSINYKADHDPEECHNTDETLPHHLSLKCMEKVRSQLSEVLYMVREWITRSNSAATNNLFELVQFKPLPGSTAPPAAASTDVSNGGDTNIDTSANKTDVANNDNQDPNSSPNEDGDDDHDNYVDPDPTATTAPERSVPKTLAPSRTPVATQAGPSTEAKAPTLLVPTTRPSTRSQSRPRAEEPKPAESKSKKPVNPGRSSKARK